MNRLAYLLHRKSREKKFQLFMRLLNPTATTTILNVGAFGLHSALPEQFESRYQHRSRITGGGLSFPEIQAYQRSFPGVNAVVFDGCALPSPDKSFDVVYSNAVIEHLPDWESQQRFAIEITRVGRGWFVTAPNLWFPVDLHYHLPLIQFLPERRQKNLVQRLGKTPYEHLNLVSKTQLKRLFPLSDVIGCRVTFYAETLIAYRASLPD